MVYMAHYNVSCYQKHRVVHFGRTFIINDLPLVLIQMIDGYLIYDLLCCCSY